MAQTDLTIRDDYYSGARLERILHSIGQAERGEVVTKSFAELETMADE